MQLNRLTLTQNRSALLKYSDILSIDTFDLILYGHASGKPSTKSTRQT